MSLDIYLDGPKPEYREHSGIFIRENGAIIEVSADEYQGYFPGRDPVVLSIPEFIGNEALYHCNITHNLNIMAEAAGIYNELWRPDEIGITHAKQLIEPLTAAHARLLINPGFFKEYNPSNGWGDYEGLLAFIASYLQACIVNPDAEIRISR